MFFDENTPSEVKKTAYRKYLVESGVVDRLTEILGKLMNNPQRPTNPMLFIREELGDTPVTPEEIYALQQEVDDARREVRRLTSLLKRHGLSDEEQQPFKSTEKDFVPRSLFEPIVNTELTSAIVKQEPEED